MRLSLPPGSPEVTPLPTTSLSLYDRGMDDLEKMNAQIIRNLRFSIVMLTLCIIGMGIQIAIQITR
jgi:hypothetical protein